MLGLRKGAKCVGNTLSCSPFGGGLELSEKGVAVLEILGNTPGFSYNATGIHTVNGGIRMITAV
jgi:hypothetical protein